MDKKIFFTSLYLLLVFTKTFGQVVITDEANKIDNFIKQKNVSLRLESKNKGFLLSKVSLKSLNDSYPLKSHVKGILIFNTKEDKTLSLEKSLYYNNGTSWVILKNGSSVGTGNIIGDLKYSYQKSDHDGWYILDGRSTSLLPTNLKKILQNLGIKNNLPDGKNLYLKSIKDDGTETISSVVGNENLKIKNEHLPLKKYTLNVDLAGKHTHSTRNTSSESTREILAFSSSEILGRTTPGFVVSSGSAGSSNTIQNSTSDGNHSHDVDVKIANKNDLIDNSPVNITSNIFIYLGS